MLGGQLGDLPLPWVTNRADLFPVRSMRCIALMFVFHGREGLWAVPLIIFGPATREEWDGTEAVPP